MDLKRLYKFSIILLFMGIIIDQIVTRYFWTFGDYETGNIIINYFWTQDSWGWLDAMIFFGIFRSTAHSFRVGSPRDQKIFIALILFFGVFRILSGSLNYILVFVV